MLVVSLVATLCAAGLWTQWRAVEVEQADRSRVQGRWLLTGTLDWARALLREDALAGSADHLGEAWAQPLRQMPMAAFLAAAEPGAAAADIGAVDDAQALLSIHIVDLQSRLNITNLVGETEAAAHSLVAFRKLFDLLDLPQAELDALVAGLRRAGDAQSAAAPLMPLGFEDLAALGLSPASIFALAPHATLLPTPTPLNLNTAGVQALCASVEGLSLADAQRIVASRDAVPFASVAEGGRIVPELRNLLTAGRHSVASHYFEVHSELRGNPPGMDEVALLRRDGEQVTVIARTAPAARVNIR